MHRLLTTLTPLERDIGDDNDGTPNSRLSQAPPPAAEAPSHWLTSGSQDSQYNYNDDDQFLTALPSHTDNVNNNRNSDINTSQQHSQPHHKHANPILEVSVVVMWSLVILGLFYYVVSEKRRHRQSLRRQRRERLEHYSPGMQAGRADQLYDVLQQTTMVVSESDLSLLEGGQQQQPSLGFEDAIESQKSLQDIGFSYSESSLNISAYQDGEQKNVGVEKILTGTTSMSHILNQQSYSDFPDVETGRYNKSDGELLCVYGGNDDEIDGQKDDENNKVQNFSHAQELHFTDSSDNDDDQWTLRLPVTSATSGLAHMEVPATCIVCLKQYRPKDRVTWSPTNNNSNNTGRCCHAFHQDCIVQWLAKVPNCNCPVCRNTFCHLPPQKSSKANSSTAQTEAPWWR